MYEIYLIHMRHERDYYIPEDEFRIFDEYEQFKQKVLNILSIGKVDSFRLYKLKLYSPQRVIISDKPLIEIKPEIVNSELVFKEVNSKTDS